MERERRLVRERQMAASGEDEEMAALLEALEFHRRRSGVGGSDAS